MLSLASQQRLVEIARESVELGLRERPGALPDLSWVDGELAQPGATFVTLRRGDVLLGCIGTMEPARPLAEDVAHNAAAAAFADPRLPPVTRDDLAEMDVKVSVLGPLEQLDVADLDALRRALRPGVDGLVVVAGRHRGTFLPSVWEQVPDVDQFLAQLWQKAGLKPGTWPGGLEVYRYHTLEFGTSEGSSAERARRGEDGP